MSCQISASLSLLPLSAGDISSPSSASRSAEGTTGVTNDKRTDAPLKAAQLSKRGQAHAVKITPFWCIFDRMLQDAYCPRTNPSGVVNLGIANNSLMEAELLQFAKGHTALEPTDLTYGTSLFGSTRLFNAFCHHFNTYFSPFESVQPHHIITAPGCGSLLDQISTHLLDEGDSFLCAAPMYNGFPADAEPRSGVRVVPVYSPHGSGEGVEDEWYHGEGALAGFQDALAAETDTSSGTCKVKAIMLCQPHNPIGRCYDRDAMVAYGRFCQKNNLHLVSDEIYALSTFPTSDNGRPQPFVSALSIDWEAEGVHPSRISVIYSASKDTGLNGIRVGALVTQHNPELMAAMKVTAKLNMIGSPSDALYSALLLDRHFFPRFVATNRARLTSSYETIKSWLLHHKLSYSPSNAGHFVMVDFTPLLPKIDKDGKAVEDLRDADTLLWAKALEHKVAITPGSNYNYPRPGVFRVTFSLLPTALNEGLRRLELVLGLDDNPWTPPKTELPTLGLQGTAAASTVPTGMATAAGGESGAASAQLGTPSSVEEAILGSRRPRKRRHTEGTSDFDLCTARLPELNMEQLTALRNAGSSCCC
ncbi:unnamed protein product [Tilletia controversa]|uniref:Aminotransferase class I/classII large domain-containing protein n=1 Tax=Tilletia controversa TaxID=13291 RepID=A0A8X7MYG9_9BASI|nr:hypothetical protein CF328_g940 [Tilletia controversa]KAE8254579.1 hypothetical protein A4X06_0g828 [Tilletia controversa]CAD6912890.1 unnamed protein product [Tilletia controversa]CAD6915582.1 unnamed protein product [Tilletia controversa]CAD6947990.1 unnamed protein product [Tilletia controversa]